MQGPNTPHFLDIVCFLHTHLDPSSKAALRLVSKQARDAINLNVRHLTAELNYGYEPLNMPLLLSKLPNLESIIAESDGFQKETSFVPMFKGAQLVRTLSRLELSISYFGMMRNNPEALSSALKTIRRRHWPFIKSLSLSGIGMRLAPYTIKGLATLSTLTSLDLSNNDFSGDPVGAIKVLSQLTLLQMLVLSYCKLHGKAVSQMKPGHWPHLQELKLSNNDFSGDPVGAIKVLSQLTLLQNLGLYACKLTGKAMSKIKPSHWPQLQELDIGYNDFSDDPVGAVKELLHLTSLQVLQLTICELTGETVSQIKPGHWSQLQKLDLTCNDFSDDPVGAMKGLLHLTSLHNLTVDRCNLSEESISQTKAGDWPHLRELDLGHHDFSDNTVGAMKVLLHLTSLQVLRLAYCDLTGDAVAQIKAGDWPHLQKLNTSGSDFSDDPVGVMKGLLHLTSLQRLNVRASGRWLTAGAISQIKPTHWPHLEYLNIDSSEFNDDPVGAMKALLQLTSLQELQLYHCNLTGEAVAQIKPGDWPQLQTLGLAINELDDDPEGAMKGLLHLTSLQHLNVESCGLTGESISQIKAGDWSQLQVLKLDHNHLGDVSINAI